MYTFPAPNNLLNLNALWIVCKISKTVPYPWSTNMASFYFLLFLTSLFVSNSEEYWSQKPYTLKKKKKKLHRKNVVKNRKWLSFLWSKLVYLQASSGVSWLPFQLFPAKQPGVINHCNPLLLTVLIQAQDCWKVRWEAKSNPHLTQE